MDVRHIHWLGHSSFRIEDGDTQIYLDPWKLPSGSPRADLILITHGHSDHCSPDDVRKIAGTETVVAATAEATAKLKRKAEVVVAGRTYTLAGHAVEVVPAYNVGKSYHPRESGGVGYIITLSGGQRIYHAGDTDVIPEMQQIKADVALLPCGGTYTMTAAEAAQAASSFRPTIVIPMHWGDIIGSKKDAETLKQLFGGVVEIKNAER